MTKNIQNALRSSCENVLKKKEKKKDGMHFPITKTNYEAQEKRKTKKEGSYHAKVSTKRCLLSVNSTEAFLFHNKTQNIMVYCFLIG